MVDTSVYGQDERCVVWSYGEQDRADKAPEEGVDVGMEMRVLVLMDGTAHFDKGNEVMLPKLRAADAMAESQNPKVGRMAVGVSGAAAHYERVINSSDGFETRAEARSRNKLDSGGRLGIPSGFRPQHGAEDGSKGAICGFRCKDTTEGGPFYGTSKLNKAKISGNFNI